MLQSKGAEMQRISVLTTLQVRAWPRFAWGCPGRCFLHDCNDPATVEITAASPEGSLGGEHFPDILQELFMYWKIRSTARGKLQEQKFKTWSWQVLSAPNLLLPCPPTPQIAAECNPSAWAAWNSIQNTVGHIVRAPIKWLKNVLPSSELSFVSSVFNNAVLS